MSGNHTPGPWAVLPEEVDRDYIRVRGTRLGDRYKVANVLTPTGQGVPAREAEETRANARLIAAAPELLEASQMGHEDSPGLPCGDLLAAANVLRNHMHIELAERLETKHAAERAAIAKAGGSNA